MLNKVELDYLWFYADAVHKATTDPLGVEVLKGLAAAASNCVGVAVLKGLAAAASNCGCKLELTTKDFLFKYYLVYPSEEDLLMFTLKYPDAIKKIQDDNTQSS